MIGGIAADLGGGSVSSGAIGAGTNQAFRKELEKISDPGLREWGSLIIGSSVAKMAGDGQTGAATAVAATRYNDDNSNLLKHATQPEKQYLQSVDEKLDPGVGDKVHFQEYLSKEAMTNPVTAPVALVMNAGISFYDGNYEDGLKLLGGAKIALDVNSAVKNDLTKASEYNLSSKATGQTAKVASNAGPFKNGEMFESNITTKSGVKIDALADAEIKGNTLTLDNVAVYSRNGDIKNQVGLKDFFQWQKGIAVQAKEQGFTTLVIKGERVAGSSSANPGKKVELTIDLTKNE